LVKAKAYDLVLNGRKSVEEASESSEEVQSLLFEKLGMERKRQREVWIPFRSS